MDIVTLAPSVFLMQINGVFVELLSEVFKLVHLESVKSVHADVVNIMAAIAACFNQPTDSERWS